MQRIRLKREPNLAAKHVAFAYQEEAVAAIRDLDFAAVFHEQGLGKSKIAIDLALHWLRVKAVDTVLIVAKKGLVENWKRELEQHSSVTPRVLSQNRKSNYYTLNSPARIIIAHYEAVKSERSRLKLFLKSRHVAVILDESTKIKNPDSVLTQAFHELGPAFVRRVILTGTPVANRPYDLWAQVYFLDQGESLGSDFKSFKSELDLTADLAKDSVARERFEAELSTLFARISHFSVRETKGSGIIKLPQKVYRQVVAEWEPQQLDLYRRYRDELRAVVVREGIPQQDKAEALLKRMLRLVQIASNPRLVDDSYTDEPGKLAPLRELVEDICRQGEKCIVWTTFTENADWLAREFAAQGAAKIHGKLPMDRRTVAVDRFKGDEGCRVLVATPGAAKEGLTLTVANHAIFYDRTFSLDDYLQAQDRIHRISQERTCFITNLLMEDSIDEWTDVLLHAKHLAAKLAQGDIDSSEYDEQKSYEFGDILKQVLNIQVDGGQS